MSLPTPHRQTQTWLHITIFSIAILSTGTSDAARHLNGGRGGKRGGQTTRPHKPNKLKSQRLRLGYSNRTSLPQLDINTSPKFLPRRLNKGTEHGRPFLQKTDGIVSLAVETDSGTNIIYHVGVTKAQARKIKKGDALSEIFKTTLRESMEFSSIITRAELKPYRNTTSPLSSFEDSIGSTYYLFTHNGETRLAIDSTNEHILVSTYDLSPSEIRSLRKMLVEIRE